MKRLFGHTLILLVLMSSRLSGAQVRFEFPEGGQHGDLFAAAVRPDTQALQHDADLFFNSMGLRLKATQPRELTLKIFLKQKNMLALRYHGEMSQAKALLGFYNHQDHYVALLITRNIEESKRVLRHEMLHFEIHRRLATPPAVWMDEGLAELLSYDVDGLAPSKTNRLAPFLREKVQAAHFQGQLPALQNLLYGDQESFYGAARELKYAHSAALLAYLFETQKPEVMKTFLNSGIQAARYLEHQIAKNNLPQLEKNFLTWLSR